MNNCYTKAGTTAANRYCSPLAHLYIRKAFKDLNKNLKLTNDIEHVGILQILIISKIYHLCTLV